MFFIDELKDFKMYKKKFFYPVDEENKKLNSAVILLSPNIDSSINIINHELANNKFIKSYYLEKAVLYFVQQENGRIKLKRNDDIIFESVRDITLINNKVKYTGYETDIEDVSTVINYKSINDFANLYKLKVKYPITVNIYRKTLCPESKNGNINVSSKTEYGGRIYKNYGAYLRYEMMEYLLNMDINKKNNKYSNNIIIGTALYESGLYQIHKSNWIFDPRLKTLCSYIENYITKFGYEKYIKELRSKSELMFIFESNDAKEMWDEPLAEVTIPHKYREIIDTSAIIGNKESVKINENLVLILNEDAAFNAKLKQTLYSDRIKTNKDLNAIYDKIKAKCPSIKYTYYSVDRYKNQNLFFDTFHYNEVFSRNATFKGKKGNRIYLDLMKRFINASSLSKYKKKTVVIPIYDWNLNEESKIYDFMKNVNPLSAMYCELYSNPEAFKDEFPNTEFLFLGEKSYFKINFNNVQMAKSKLALICRNVEKLKLKGFVTDEDNDEPESSPKAITADIVDKIEKSQDVTINKLEIKSEPKDEKEEIVAKVSKAAKLNNSTKDTLEVLDDDERLKKLLVDLENNAESGPKISDARVARNMQLDKQLMDKEINGKKVSDIISSSKKKQDLPKVSLKIDSVNDEWKDLTYPSSLDKYDPNEDIVNVFRAFSYTSHPLAIRNINVENTSTSEDAIETYTVEYENENGKRFSIKVDVPIMIDNKYMKLRGNRKNINGQLTLVPIVKTDQDTVQVVSYSYKKIFIRRFGTTTGKSNIVCDRLIKTLTKHQFKNIHIIEGDCTKVCAKYEVPIDYLDLAGIYSKIITPQYTFFFNQDELREKYKVDDKKGLPFGVDNNTKELLYFKLVNETSSFALTITNMIAIADNSFMNTFNSMSKSVRYTYSQASILGNRLPLIVMLAYSEGLQKVLKKANIKYDIIPMDAGRPKYDQNTQDIIKFKDGWIKYDLTYDSSLLMNGLKACDTDNYLLEEINSKPMYMDFFDLFGGRLMSDGLDNFYDIFIDPITLDVLEDYKLPTDYVEVLLYANNLLADNKFVKHTQVNGRRTRRNELIPGYLYTALAEAYQEYTRSMKHGRQTPLTIKQSAVIDKILTDNTVSDLSILTPLGEYEAINTISPKGLSGMNSDRSYTLDKRTFDESMVNVFGMSTGFAGNVGINRQATIDMNISGKRGYIRSLDKKPKELSPTKSFCMTEALTPYGCTRDDPFRTAMTFIQTSKHLMRSNNSDPSLITSGADEALPYLISNTFAYKAKQNGEIIEKDDNHMIISYDDNTSDYIDLSENVEKNSSSGFFVTLKLDSDLKVGSKVKANEIVAYDKSSFSNEVGYDKNIAYDIGKLKKCAILNTDEGYEDSAIISQELADDLTHSVVLKVEKVFSKDTNIFNLVKVGQDIEEGDPLLIIQTPFEDEDLNTLLNKLAADEDDITDLGRIKIKSKVTGVVQDIVMYRTVEKDELSESLRKAFDSYEKGIAEKKKIMKKYGIDTSKLPADYKLPATGKLKNAEDGILIEFYLKYEDKMSVGDKLIYYSALKGVVRNVFPEGQEPRSEFRPDEKIHSMLSVGSVNGRMVTSILINGAINKYLIELSRKCKEIAGMKVSIDNI